MVDTLLLPAAEAGAVLVVVAATAVVVVTPPLPPLLELLLLPPMRKVILLVPAEALDATIHPLEFVVVIVTPSRTMTVSSGIAGGPRCGTLNCDTM